MTRACCCCRGRPGSTGWCGRCPSPRWCVPRPGWSWPSDAGALRPRSTRRRPTTTVLSWPPHSVNPFVMTTETPPDRLAELEAERSFLLQSLRDLEAERAAGDVDDHD